MQQLQLRQPHFFVQCVVITLLVNIMGFEPVKDARVFSRGQYRKMPNMFVLQTKTVQLTKGEETAANIADFKSACTLEWYYPISFFI